MGKTTCAFLLALALACVWTGNSQVTLDPTFGVNGRAFINISFGFDYIYDMKVQPDGKILVGGTSAGAPVYYSVARYNTNGTRDTGFGINGVVTASYRSGLNGLMGLDLQDDGKILLTGAYQGTPETDFEYLLMRLNADGTPDTTFGPLGNGAVLNDFSFNEAANGPNDIAIQADQKIIVLGSAITQNNGRDFAVIRYNTDGSIDNTFGDGGVQFVNFIPTANTDNGSKVKIQTDGKILVVGYSGPVPSYDLSVARLNTDGSLDATFGNNGKVTYDLGGADRDMCVAVTDENEIFVGGTMNYNNYQNTKAIILKLKADGTKDTTFGDNGQITIAIGDDPHERLGNLLVQEDGKILVGANAVQDILVFRYTADGLPDTTFNSTGSVTVSTTNPMEIVNDIALQNDGKIVVAGATLYSSNDWDFAVTRFAGNDLSTVTASAQTFSIYPNPAASILNIEGNFELKSALIFNFLGQLVKTTHSKSIDIADLPAGSYLMQIDNGKNVETVKFLKN
jgi:uncharacterized delta-60 repeat protein